MAATTHLAHADRAYYERVRTTLPSGSTPDAHDLDSPALEALFALLAIDHPDRVTPAEESRTSYRARPARREQLGNGLVRLVGRHVAEVRITPARYGTGTVWCAMVLGTNGKEIPLPQGAAAKISSTFRRAFNKADWSRPQDYDVAAGVLTVHITVVPECLRDLDGAL